MQNPHLTLLDVNEPGGQTPDQESKSYWELPHACTRPHTRRYQRVLLLNPAATLYKTDIPRCTYPLGIGYIASTLERYGYEVRIFDCYAEGHSERTPLREDPDFIHYGVSDDRLIELLRDFGPDIVGISSIFSNQADNVHHLLQVIRSCSSVIHTVIGGAHARYFPKACLHDPNLDAVFLGEGEGAFLAYLEALNGNGDRGEVPLLAFREGTSYSINARQVLLRTRDPRLLRAKGDLDELPHPAWHLINMEKYFTIKTYHSPYTKGSRVGQVYTSRGCSAKCTFCTTTNFWANALRRRSVQNVIEELQRLRHEHQIDEFHIIDDNLTNDMEHAKQVLREFKTLSLPWATPQGTALWRMDEELLDLMKESGAYQVTFAIESGVQRVLDELIRKPLDLARTQHLIAYAKRIGLAVHGFFIIGMPPMFGHAGESLEEMEETFHFAVDAGFDSASFFTATPIIGSRLLDECLRQGFVEPALGLYRMSYKQGLISVPGLWSGKTVSELAATFNQRFNDQRARPYHTIREWSSLQY